jgi:hypothetical protein
VFAHPTRREAWKRFEPSWADKLLGVEVWNRKYDGWAPSRTAPGISEKSGGIRFVGLDFHTRRQSFPLAMALNLDREDINEQNVIDCLRRRRCHARALGFRFNQRAFTKAGSLLAVVEKSRRTAAAIFK